MFSYEFIFFLAACFCVQISLSRYTGDKLEEHELLPPVIQALAIEPLPKDPLVIDDFRNHAINVGNMIAELLRHEMRMLSRISKTPIGSPSLMLEPTNAIINGGVPSSPPVGSNQIPITTTVITTYAGAPPSGAITTTHSSPNQANTQTTFNQAFQANNAETKPSMTVANTLPETPTGSVAPVPLAYYIPPQTNESSQPTQHATTTDTAVDQMPLNSVPAPPPVQTNAPVPNQQDSLASSAHQLPPAVVANPFQTDPQNGHIVFYPSHSPPAITTNPLVTNQLNGHSDSSSSESPANPLSAVQLVTQPTQATVAQPLPVEAPPAANPIM